MIEVALGDAAVAFSTREGGVSEGPFTSLNLGLLQGDDPARVIENRRRLARSAGFDPVSAALGRQVHGSDVLEWTAAPRPSPLEDVHAPLPQVDGHATTEFGLALIVLVADCLPVALAAPGRVAMLHCGWRGLAAGIVRRAIELFDAVPAAAIGPGIGRCCYEVGDEVGGRFGDVPGAFDGRRLDLRLVAAHRLREGGVGVIESTELCTSCRADLFFSHRRDGETTGRQAGVVRLRERA